MATCKITYTSASGSPHSISAVYGGDTNYTTSTSNTVLQAVNATSSSTVLASSANPSLVGAQVTYTATVSGAGVMLAVVLAVVEARL